MSNDEPIAQGRRPGFRIFAFIDRIEFEYTFDAPAAGRYALTARVVTPSWKQHLLVTANGAEEPIDIALPFTVGMWEETEPVEITLAKGLNILRFTHEGGKGTTIKDFTLKRK